MYADGEYDLAGFTVGAVERANLIDGSSIREGDALLGIASSGPHSNGYSLIRKVLDRVGPAEIDGESAEARLLAPTRIYASAILALIAAVPVKGLAHITGGGLSENVPRILHGALDAEIDVSSWQQGPVFDWLAENGNIEVAEMRRTFNCGVGMVAVVDEADVSGAIELLEKAGERAWRLGRVVAGNRTTRYV
jgi:phosphoribosylformylglycinamidine cyclo-ligase